MQPNLIKIQWALSTQVKPPLLKNTRLLRIWTMKLKTYSWTKVPPKHESKPLVTVLMDLIKARSTLHQLSKKLSLSKKQGSKSLRQNLTKEPKPPTLSPTQRSLSKKSMNYSSNLATKLNVRIDSKMKLTNCTKW